MNGTLYFGGSFNPPHLAHVACSAAAARAAGLGGVILVPTGRPNLKDVADVAPPEHRVAMTHLAAANAGSDVLFAVDDLEIGRPGTTYTFDTVETLAARGVRPVNWLIGADQLLNLHRWHRFEELLETARLWVMARPGYVIDWNTVHPAVEALRDDVVTVPQLDVSATEIRRRLRAGESTDGLLHPAVRAYCDEHRLYGE